MTHQNTFRYQLFLLQFLGIPVVDHVLSSQEQEIQPTTSLDENKIQLDFQTDRNV